MGLLKTDHRPNGYQIRIQISSYKNHPTIALECLRFPVPVHFQNRPCTRQNEHSSIFSRLDVDTKEKILLQIREDIQITLIRGEHPILRHETTTFSSSQKVILKPKKTYARKNEQQERKSIQNQTYQPNLKIKP